MVVTSTAFVISAARSDRTTAALGLPLPAWLGFATLMATDIWQANRVSAKPRC